MSQGDDRRRVNKGYHYVRYALFGFFLIFFVKTIEWTVVGVIPTLWISALLTGVMVVIVTMDVRNQALWRANERVESGPDPGRRVVTWVLYPFYGACWGALVLLPHWFPHHSLKVPVSASVSGQLQQPTSKVGAPSSERTRPQETLTNPTPMTPEQEHPDGSTKAQQDLLARIRRDQLELQALATRRRQLAREIDEGRAALENLVTKTAQAGAAAASQARLVEAERQRLAELRIALQSQKGELAALQRSLDRQRAGADSETARLAQRAQLLAAQGWTITLNTYAAIALIVACTFLVGAAAWRVYVSYYR